MPTTNYIRTMFKVCGGSRRTTGIVIFAIGALAIVYDTTIAINFVGDLEGARHWVNGLDLYCHFEGYPDQVDGDGMTAEVACRNLSRRDIEIHAATTSCSCLSVAIGAPVKIGPGQEKILTVSIHASASLLLAIEANV